jgi:hypothetical protein
MERSLEKLAHVSDVDDGLARPVLDVNERGVDSFLRF